MNTAHKLINAICDAYGCEVEDLDRTFYDETKCGGHITLDTGDHTIDLQVELPTEKEWNELQAISIHSIVEGSDAEFSYHLPFIHPITRQAATLEDFFQMVMRLEIVVDHAWHKAND